MSDSPTPSPDLAAAVQLAREAKAQPPPATADAPQHPANLISLADAVDIVMDRVFVERSEMADAILRLPSALPTSRAPASPHAMTPIHNLARGALSIFQVEYSNDDNDMPTDGLRQVESVLNEIIELSEEGAAARPAEPPPIADVLRDSLAAARAKLAEAQQTIRDREAELLRIRTAEVNAACQLEKIGLELGVRCHGLDVLAEVRRLKVASPPPAAGTLEVTEADAKRLAEIEERYRVCSGLNEWEWFDAGARKDVPWLLTALAAARAKLAEAQHIILALHDDDIRGAGDMADLWLTKYGPVSSPTPPAAPEGK